MNTARGKTKRSLYVQLIISHANNHVRKVHKSPNLAIGLTSANILLNNNKNNKHAAINIADRF